MNARLGTESSQRNFLKVPKTEAFLGRILSTIISGCGRSRDLENPPKPIIKFLKGFSPFAATEL